MSLKKRSLLWVRKNKLWIISLTATLLYMGVAACIWNSYYYINDDFIIRDILSGRYSGVGDAHIYNVIYPFAYVLKFLYQCFPTVDFWGITLYGMVYVCMLVCMHRVLELLRVHWTVSVLLTYGAFTVTALYTTVYFTFTFTGSLCAAAGLFLFVTADAENIRFRNYVPSLLLTIFAFLIRKDTFFMLLPFYALWGLFLMIKNKEHMKTFLGLLRPAAALAAACALLWGSHVIAFSDEQWSDFLVFRELRKSVHDYYGYPDYAEARELYDSLGLSYEEYAVAGTTGIGGINTVLDLSTDIRTVLKEVGEYVSQQNEALSFHDRLVSGLNIIKTNFNNRYVYANLLMLVGLLAVSSAVAVYKKRYRLLAALPGGVLLSALELVYLGYRGRLNFVVTVSEIAAAVLWTAGILLCAAKGGPQKSGFLLRRTVPLIFCMLLFITCSAKCIRYISFHQDSFSTAAEQSETLIGYCKSNPENVYFEPALLMSDRTFKLGETDCDFNNLLVLGGWNATSPEYNQALAAFGIGGCTVEQAILNRENVYVISNDICIAQILQYFEWKYGDSLSYETVDTLDIFDGCKVFSFSLADLG